MRRKIHPARSACAGAQTRIASRMPRSTRSGREHAAFSAVVVAANAGATPDHATLALGGSWAGTYSGAVSGKFTLTWTQTNGRLKGVIKLSQPSGTYRINGSVTRGKIKFGAVNVGAIYKGSV